MSSFRWLRALIPLLCLFAPVQALAGMPTPQLVLTELGKRRLEELSFFLMGFLLMAAVVQWLWNYVQHDFPKLPRLTYRRTVALLLVWGLAMTVVLTLISGARELMTPGAWEPNGITHKLKSASPSSAEVSKAAELDEQRRQKLDALRFALWQFAATHEGRLPNEEEATSIPEETWQVQAGGTLKYVYIPGLSTQQPDAVLVYEPKIYDDGQLVLRTSGVIAKLSEVTPPMTKEEK